MRTLILGSIALASAAALSACATSGTNSDAQEYAQLQSACEARGGQFVTSGRMTGRPGLDNACKYTSAKGTPEGFDRN